MSKIKIFTRGTATDFDKLENEINEWFSNNKNVKIIDIKMGVCSYVNVLNESYVNCTTIIYYIE